jgi:hypothetical protein
MAASLVGRRQLGQIEDGLSARDRAIVTTIASLRYVTTRQLETLHFADLASAYSAARSARRVLERLARQRVVARLERRVGGVRAGSASFIYQLGPIGERLARAGRRRRDHEPSRTFLDHTLAVADVAVALHVAQRTGRCELEALQVEPESWRTVRTGLAGVETLRPDLSVILGVGDLEHRWFVEVDLGTEHVPTVVRKCRLYDRYYGTGEEQHAHGVFPRVLWSVPDADRAARIRAALAHERPLTGEQFAVTESGRLVDTLVGGRA